MSKLEDARKTLYAAAIDYAADTSRWQVLCQAASEYHLARMKAAGLGPADLQNLEKGMAAKLDLDATKAALKKTPEAQRKLEESIGARFVKALEDPKGAQAFAALARGKR